MKHKTAELEGALLDAAVALAEGYEFEMLTIGTVNPRAECQAALPGDDGEEYWTRFEPSKSWEEGGPIIEREKITVGNPNGQPGWTGAIAFPKKPKRNGALQWGHYWECGPTPLVAAMRTYVASKLGEEVELP